MIPWACAHSTSTSCNAPSHVCVCPVMHITCIDGAHHQEGEHHAAYACHPVLRITCRMTMPGLEMCEAARHGTILQTLRSVSHTNTFHPCSKSAIILIGLATSYAHGNTISQNMTSTIPSKCIMTKACVAGLCTFTGVQSSATCVECLVYDAKCRMPFCSQTLPGKSHIS